MAYKDTVTFDVLKRGESGAGLLGTSSFGAPRTYRRSENGIIVTTIKFDLTGLTDLGGTNNDIISLSGGGEAYLGQYVIAKYGVVFKTYMVCIEAATSGGTITQDIDIQIIATPDLEYGEDAGGSFVINGATMVLGQGVVNVQPALTANHYMYIAAADTAGSAGTYTAGQYILRLYGHAPLVGE